MRRKDKEIEDRSEIESIINKSLVCRLAMADENGPYIVPLCFGYKDNTLYFHSAVRGKKIDILRNNPRVCFEFDSDSEIQSGETACKFGMRYRSVIGFGTAVIIDNPNDKRHALDVIMANYTKGQFTYTDEGIRKTAVIRVDIDTLTGKSSL
jgi:nitroimidazol reductase NimA-like FMN-containing flavoprotein (pyridoxamine 5'-phosphate oxidase superfamily)